MRKKLAIIGFVLLSLSAVVLGATQLGQSIAAPTGVQPARAAQESAATTVGASGSVRSNQSALLTWQSSGTVGSAGAAVGDTVASGQELAVLAPASLPQNVILARADLAEAKKALDEVLNSTLQQAQALKAVEEARKALDDLKNPGMAQAQTQQAVAEAQKAVDQANLQMYILTTPPAQAVIEQSYANMLLAENKLNKTQKQVERMQRQVKKAPLFLRGRLEKSIQNMHVQIIQEQRSYDRAVMNYEDLLAPPDAIDLAKAQADLKAAQARLAEAQREDERLKDGFAESEMAMAEARLADAQREWERLKDGPDPADIARAKARVAAAEASLNRRRLTAPFEGVITQVFSKPGDLVSPGSPAFRLDDLSRLLVDVQVSEVDINQVQVGQAAVLTLDAIPGKDYHGTVIETAPVGIETAGVVYYPVTIEITDADSLVRPGMTAGAEIITGYE